MARDHTEKEEAPQVPQVIEREITLSTLNAKLNDALNLLFKIAEKAEVKLD